MKRSGLRHPKVFELAALLKKDRPTAIGYLELLFDFAATYAPQGNIGRYPAKRIAAALDWHGRPEHLLDCLVQSGWVDTDPIHTYLVHDWADHADRATLTRLSRAGLKPIQANQQSTDKVCTQCEIVTELGVHPPARAQPEPVPEPVPEAAAKDHPLTATAPPPKAHTPTPPKPEPRPRKSDLTPIERNPPTPAEIEKVRQVLIWFVRGGTLQSPDDALCRQLIRWAGGSVARVGWWISLKHSAGRDGSQIQSWGWFRQAGECELPGLVVPAEVLAEGKSA